MVDKQVVLSALTTGVMMVTSDGTAYCAVCDKAISEPAPHLKGKDHENHFVWYTLHLPSPPQELLNRLPDEVRAAKLENEVELVDKALFSYKCRLCPKKNPLTGIEPLKDHLKGNVHEKARKIQESFPKSPFEGEKTFAYKCWVCDKQCTGEPPLLDHLRSRKHKNKVWALVSRRRMNLDAQGGNNIQPLVRIYPTDGQWTFPWTVESTTPPQRPSDTVYRNLSTPRGLVLIFNYYFTGQGLHERKGAKRDSFNLETLFRRMGYEVNLYEDERKSETKELLKKQQENPYLSFFDSLIVFVLSHGKDNLQFSCSDGEWMSLDDVRYCFTDNNCPALSGKPKLFFVNFCRGKIIEPHMQYDSQPIKQVAPRDMMTMYACINSFQAPRHCELGTVFVQVLCEVLAAHAHNSEMHDLTHRINKLTQERGGATPEVQTYHFKNFYFNPCQQ